MSTLAPVAPITPNLTLPSFSVSTSVTAKFLYYFEITNVLFRDNMCITAQIRSVAERYSTERDYKMSEIQTKISPRDAAFVKKYAAPLIAFGEFIDGYDLTVISVAMVFMTQTFALTAADKGLLVAISFVGTAFGLIVFGDLSDRIGRKKVFAFNLWVFVFTAVGAAFITQVWMLWIMRFLIGVAIGMDLSTSSAYLAEIAPKAKRGRITGVLLNAMLVFGAIFCVLLALGLYAVVPANHHEYIWRGMFLFAAIPALIILVLRRRLPESPRWLIQHGQTDQAENIIAALGLTREFAEAKPKPTQRDYRTLLKGKTLRRVVVCTAFFMLNSTAGPIVSFMGPVIFAQAGIPKASNLIVTLAANIVAAAALILGSLFIDRVNRRTLGIITAAILTVAAATLGLLGHLSAAILFAAFIIWSFTTYFGPGMLAVVWAVEAYPTELRGFGAGLTQSMARVMSSITVFIIPVLVSKWGYYAIAPFAAVYFMMLLLVIFNPWLANSSDHLEHISQDE